MIIARSRGISIMQTGIGPVILLNLVITFTIPGISIGGHLGGLIGGAAIAAIIVELDKRRRSGAATWRRSWRSSVGRLRRAARRRGRARALEVPELG